MGFWTDLKEWAGFGASEAKMSSAELDRIIRGGHASGSGAVVDWGTSLQVTTVLACARVIAEGVAQVPFKLYRGDGGRETALDHPLYDLLYRRPNDWQTSFEFRETLALHVVLTGNAYVQKMMVGRNRELRALEPIEPAAMRVERKADGTFRYLYRPMNGAEREVDPATIWHIRGPSWNSYVGLDVTRLAREAIGLAIATEASHADFHRNGARVSGQYSVKGVLNQQRFDQLSAWMDRHAQGGDRSGKPLILDNDATFHANQMTGVDAQHIEVRKHQVEEICRAMRVMPIMAGVPGAAGAYDNGEQMFIAHVVHTMMPWYERIEQSADVNLLSAEDRRAGYYSKFNPNALMRGSAKDRAEFYAKALGSGGHDPWMTQDEVRELEELTPKGGRAAELGIGAMNAQPPAGNQGS